MKIEPDHFRGCLTVDVQTRRDGNSASKIAWDDDTVVIFGGLQALVELRDLRVVVVMNPDEGKWRDLRWARERAMAVLCKPDITPLFVAALADFHFQLGEEAGRESLRYELRKLLGISQAVAAGLADTFCDGENEL
jgi:hypothetical protein